MNAKIMKVYAIICVSAMDGPLTEELDSLYLLESDARKECARLNKATPYPLEVSHHVTSEDVL